MCSDDEQLTESGPALPSLELDLQGESAVECFIITPALS